MVQRSFLTKKVFLDQVSKWLNDGQSAIMVVYETAYTDLFKGLVRKYVDWVNYEIGLIDERTDFVTER